jgi:hypothetical protein
MMMAKGRSLLDTSAHASAYAWEPRSRGAAYACRSHCPRAANAPAASSSTSCCASARRGIWDATSPTGPRKLQQEMFTQLRQVAEQEARRRHEQRAAWRKSEAARLAEETEAASQEAEIFYYLDAADAAQDAASVAAARVGQQGVLSLEEAADLEQLAASNEEEMRDVLAEMQAAVGGEQEELAEIFDFLATQDNEAEQKEWVMVDGDEEEEAAEEADTGSDSEGELSAEEAEELQQIAADTEEEMRVALCEMQAAMDAEAQDQEEIFAFLDAAAAAGAATATSTTVTRTMVLDNGVGALSELTELESADLIAMAAREEEEIRDALVLLAAQDHALAFTPENVDASALL